MKSKRKQAGQSIDILVVEDSPTQAESLRFLLEENGYAVSRAENGEKALAAVERRKPDLLISDVLMPVMDGYELCRQIKSRDDLRDLPVILLTSLASPQDVINALKCGADNFVRKPYRDRYLLSRIEDVLSSRSLRRRERVPESSEVSFKGRTYLIHSDRSQILDLLISTYEQAVEINGELDRQNARLIESEQSLQTLFRIADMLNRSKSERTIFSNIVDLVLELPGIKGAWVVLLEDNTFRTAASGGLPAALQKPGAMDGECLCLRMLLVGEMRRKTCVLQCERLKKTGADEEHLMYHATVPLWIEGRIFGLMNLLAAGKDLFAESDLEILTAVGNQIGVAVERTRLAAQMEERLQDRTKKLKEEIAERKRVESALRESAERYRMIFQRNPQPMWVHDAETLSFLAVNEAAVRHYGFSEEEFLSMTILEIRPKEDIAALLKYLKEAACSSATRTSFWRHRKKDGTVFHVEITSNEIVLDGRRARIVLSQDITERKKVEEESARLTAILEATTDFVAITNDQGNAIYLNSSAKKLLGIGGEERSTEASEWSMRPYLDEQGQDLVFQVAIPAAVQNGFWDGECVVINREGRQVPVSLVIVAHRGAGGKVEYLSAIARDISQRKQAEEELRQSEEKYRTIIETIKDGYYEVDVAGNLTFFNDSLCEIFGYARADLMGLNNRAYMDPENAAKVYQAFNRVFRTGRAAEAFDWEIIRRDGTRRYIEASVSLVRNQAGEPAGFRGIVRDITDRKEAQESRARLEEQLHQSQKMESIGQLAGGVAHDFNNILMAISSYCELLLMTGRNEDSWQTSIAEIRRAADQGSGLTRQLLAFSRKQVLEPTVLDLNTVIAEMDNMLRRLLGEQVKLRAALDPDLGPVRTDRAQIEQVILNLTLNARDAMPDGGHVMLETFNVEFNDYTSQSADALPGRYALLKVSDTGHGMDEAIKSRIFEPFFTTKEKGRGTGLGLSTVYGIVKQSGGHIEVVTQRGKGASFSVYLPQTEGPAEGAGPSGLTASFKSCGETLVLVDDNEEIRDALGALLRAGGYFVLCAGSGEEALEILRNRKERIDLVITDFVMPGMNGRVLAEQIRSDRPASKILFLSGYLESEGHLESIIDSGTGFLQKPVAIDVLLKKIRKLLDASDCEGQK